MNKRDAEMLRRRRDQLKCPTSREIELELEKYQATEKRLTEVKDYLVNPKCPILTFYMYQNQMDDHKTDILCEAIRKNCSLKAIHLIKCTLRQNQLTKVCDAICKHRSQSIQEIHISQMRINRQGAEAIAQVLSNTFGLLKLELIDTNLDNESMLHICQGIQNSMSLEYLDLRKNIFDEQGLVALVKALKENMSIKQLFLEDLKFNKKQACMLADLLGEESCNIEQLALNQADFDIDTLDTIMEALCKADHLHKLSLAKNILNVNICSHLSEIPKRLHHFQILCLSHCELGHDGLKSLCAGFYGINTIKELDLSWNNIESEGMQIILEMLQKNKSLEKLLIQHNYLQEAGAQQMVEALKLHPQMRYLDISANEIASQGFLYFMELFESNHRLNNLHLRKNAIDGTQIKNLPKSLNDNTNLYYLDLQDNEIENECAEKLIELLKMNYFIEDLVLKGNLHINQNLKETIQEECRKNLMIKEFVLPHLKSNLGAPLNLNHQPSQEESHFKNYNVEELKLQDCSFYRSDFIVKFIEMNQRDFHSLSLTRVHFDEHIKDLAEFLKKSNTQISKLTLNDCDIGDTSITQLVADCRVLKNLRELRLIRMNMKDHAKEIVKYLLDHKNLKILDLSFNNLSRMGCISEFLMKNQVLQELNLEGNPIQQEVDLRSLLFGLTQNISLVQLRYDQEAIMRKTDQLGQKEIRLIEQQLQINRFIEKEILPKQTQRNLKNSDTVDLSHTLDFMSPEMRPEAKQSVIQAILKYIMIQVPGQLKKTKINMSYCRVDDETVEKFVDGMMSDVIQQKIDLLDLSYNHIGDEACKHLAKLFAANFHFNHLIIGKNENITKDGLRSILAAIRGNNFIQYIDAQTCNIELEGQTKAAVLERELILEHIQENCSLVELDLQFNRVNEQWLKKIATELEQNRLISDLILPSIEKKQTEEYKKAMHSMQRKPTLGERFRESTQTLNGRIMRRLTRKTEISGGVQGGKGTTTTNAAKLRKSLSPTAVDDAGALRSQEEDAASGADRELDSQENWTHRESKIVAQSNMDKSDLMKDEKATKMLSLKGKGLQSLDFLEKYMRVNPHLVDIDIGDNPLTNKEMQKFTMNLRKNQLIRKIGVDGISGLDEKTKNDLQSEVKKNEKIAEYIEMQKSGNLDKNILALENKDIQCVDALHKFIFLEEFQDLKVLDLTDNRLGNRGAIEICNLIRETKTIQTLNLQKNRIGPSGLSHICSAMTVNESIKVLDIRDNMIQDESLKTLFAMLHINEVIMQIKFTVTNDENISRVEQFNEYRNQLTVEEIIDKLEMDHGHELTCRQKACLPLWCWNSFIHAKHEAFRFKYDSKCLKMVENEIMPAMTYSLYANSCVYYFIVFFVPMLFVNECGNSLNMWSHGVYAVYSILNWIIEIIFVIRIQRKINNKQILRFNKWHFVESIMGQVARFDTYLDMCFFVLLYQCQEWYLVIPIGTLIIIYVSYPIYSLIKLWSLKQTFDHAMPRIERNCDICFVRENMLMATVLDSFCIDNHTEICKKPYHFGRVQAIWTLATQDGPQMLIHLLFMFLVQNDISHADTTVIMSIIVSSFAIGISIFNIVMCSQNEFDPILLMIELKKRQDAVNLREQKIKEQKDELKKRMMANTGTQSKMAEIGKLGMSLNRKATVDKLRVPDSTQRALLRRRQNQRSELFQLPHDVGSDSTSQYGGYFNLTQPRNQPLIPAKSSFNDGQTVEVNDIDFEQPSSNHRQVHTQIYKSGLQHPVFDSHNQAPQITHSIGLSPAHITEQSQERAQETARRNFEDSLRD